MRGRREGEEQAGIAAIVADADRIGPERRRCRERDAAERRDEAEKKGADSFIRHGHPLSCPLWAGGLNLP